VKLLATGGQGQLGRALARRAPVHGHAVAALDRAALDVCDARQIDAALDAHGPAAVINAAAYTGVDRAEQERDAAHAVNAIAPGVLAAACARRSIALIHISTDYVFDGALRRPYREDDAMAPLGVYGATKAAGERAVIAAGGIVLRTSWLFSATGHNFVKTIVRLAAERSELRVVADQHGCPSCTDDIADAAIGLAERATAGASLDSTYHAADAGPTTWHGFACAIVDAARGRRTLACERVVPITTAEYPTPVRRPAYSVLDTTRIRRLGIEMPPWLTGLGRVIAELYAGNAIGG
jgi:dTDP-4-dehydrorhamnose reductase